jgi:glycosyltransferase involved in cell wall biosynthesis
MRILHVSTPVSWRGGEQQIAYLAGVLATQDIPQHVCCPSGSPLERACASLPVTVHPFSGRGFLGLSLARRIRRIVRQERITVVHAHDSHAHTSAVLAAALFDMPAPVIVSRRVDFPVSPTPFSRWKYNHPSVRRILCVSGFIRDVLARSVTDTSRLHVVYDGIDTDRFSAGADSLHDEFGIDPSRRIVGNASALADHKDYLTFVDTAEQILRSHKDVAFLIVGDGPERERIRQYIASKGLERDIIMAGFRSDVHRLLPGFDVFLMTSSSEGLGSVVLDAFAAGVPVVSTDAGGLPEIVVQGRGLVAPVKDAPALAAQVCALLDDTGLRERIVRTAREAVRLFSKEQMAGSTLEHYRLVEHS